MHMETEKKMGTTDIHADRERLPALPCWREAPQDLAHFTERLEDVTTMFSALYDKVLTILADGRELELDEAIIEDLEKTLVGLGDYVEIRLQELLALARGRLSERS
jgi:hypothetical protein